jgi:hypothetical protein
VHIKCLDTWHHFMWVGRNFLQTGLEEISVFYEMDPQKFCFLVFYFLFFYFLKFCSISLKILTLPQKSWSRSQAKSKCQHLEKT